MVRSEAMGGRGDRCGGFVGGEKGGGIEGDFRERCRRKDMRSSENFPRLRVKSADKNILQL